MGQKVKFKKWLEVLFDAFTCQNEDPGLKCCVFVCCLRSEKDRDKDSIHSYPVKSAGA